MKDIIIRICLIIIFTTLIVGCGNSDTGEKNSPAASDEKSKAAEENESEEEHDSTTVFYSALEVMPEPIGGIAGIMKLIKYPESAKKEGIQGRVLIKAFIDENGLVTKTEVLKGIGAGCDSAAAAAVTQTKFIPGKNKGKNVKVQIVVPVMFKLQ